MWQIHRVPQKVVHCRLVGEQIPGCRMHYLLWVAKVSGWPWQNVLHGHPTWVGSDRVSSSPPHEGCRQKWSWGAAVVPLRTLGSPQLPNYRARILFPQLWDNETFRENWLFSPSLPMMPQMFGLPSIPTVYIKLDFCFVWEEISVEFQHETSYPRAVLNKDLPLGQDELVSLWSEAKQVPWVGSKGVRF